MSPAAPTAHSVGKLLLRDLGIVSLDPAVPANQVTTIEQGDLEEIANAMTQGFQEIWEALPLESKQRTGNGYLRAPTAVTLTVTEGSTTISALTTYAAWMLGCTIRISGDEQDNEVISSTSLARPYIGGSGGKSATIYGDCLTLDDTIEEVLDPIFFSNGAYCAMAQSRTQFIELGLYPLTGAYLPANLLGVSPTPFYWYGRKGETQWPTTWLVDGFYDSTQDYTPRRLRFAPMPNIALGVSYTAAMTPVRIISTDIDNGDHATDPGKKLPIPYGWVESIYLPVCRQILTGSPLFKAAEAKPEIARAFAKAQKILSEIKSGEGGIEAIYPRVH